MSAPKFSLSRRTALTALAGVATGSALPAVAAPTAEAAAPALPQTLTAAAATAASETVAQPPGFRVPVLIDPADPWHYAPHPAGALTTRTITGGLEVSDDTGVIATLTTGARTVTLSGARRWFTEQKKAVRDAFDRTPPTGGWGMSPGGGTWSHHNGTDTDYFIDSGRAAITLAAGKSRYSLLPDRGIGDVYAAARFSFDKLPAGAPVSLGLVLTAKDVNNHYRARLIVTPAGEVQLVLEKELADTTTTLSTAVTVGTGFKPFDHWWVRAEKTDDILRARAWRHFTTGVDDEPTDLWHHSVRDPEKAPDAVLRSGTVGVRGLASTGATVLPQARVYDFRIDTATWADPPVITHSTWVRLLPEPFDGTWTAALEQRIRAWAGDTSPDALTYSSMYRPFAPPVTDPARQNRQVLGESGYSELLDTGLREVGADFHEYMGLPWTFPSGESAQTPDPKWVRHLDCSGFVRMVYGYHLGVPMSLDPDPAHPGFLPRTSQQQAAAGPGIIVARTTDTPPPLDALRIGDLLFWNDPDDGAVSHTGIYMGRDQHGKHRFVSSRKTPNGPTIADIGGKSIIDGTASDLYTDQLRVIRRL
ncbi:C40 family peptidase [Streptomyces muensis]|uniref:C40 family peptidase n=1 Tax=Streptomyces muensis TaxID=1077944 RepID=A0A9X1PY22_STRM4|nr:NlpC/P60 family protein [Streptomyces muensis]MCF1594590.1 C40 family peptidase [Streptomyces muensis]